MLLSNLGWAEFEWNALLCQKSPTSTRGPLAGSVAATREKSAVMIVKQSQLLKH